MYTINHYNGTILANIADGVLDQTTSLSLAGRNFVGYGEYLNENQLFLLENFAGTTAPRNPITGQLWYNSSTQTIAVYTGSAYSVLANTVLVANTASLLTAQLQANINTVNTNILANVAVLNANAAVQDTQITNLWANAAVQDSSIVALTANAGAQSQHLDSIDANVVAANAAIALRANIASPVFTGNPRAPTPTVADNSTSVATTAYVMAQDDIRRDYVDTNLLANVGALATSTTTAIALRANIANPTFTGIPAAPTASSGTRTTQLATTAYVMAQDDIRRAYIDTAMASNIAALNAAQGNNLTFKANIASPVFTGVPASTTPNFGDTSTRIATTAFVQQAIVGGSALWQGSHRYISTLAPDNSQGANGDFWFQYQ
jgi:hypothetical protein